MLRSAPGGMLRALSSDVTAREDVGPERNSTQPDFSVAMTC
jgi:hypothetical protein